MHCADPPSTRQRAYAQTGRDSLARASRKSSAEHSAAALNPSGQPDLRRPRRRRCRHRRRHHREAGSQRPSV